MAGKSEREARESRLASGWIVEGDPSPAVDADPVTVPDAEPGSAPDPASGPAADSDARPQLGNGALVLLGVIGGLYLLYTWVWFSWANFYATTNAAVAEGSGALGAVLQQIVFWAAPLAPALWFCAVLVLNRGARLGRLVLWLMVGAVVLVPLPMFEFGTGA